MSGATPIETVLWDFGGVFTPSPFHAGRRFAETKGLDFDGLFAAVFGSYHDDTDHPWHRVEHGEMALADAFAEITSAANASGVSFDMKELFASMSDDGIESHSRRGQSAARCERAGCEWESSPTTCVNSRSGGDA